MASGFDLVFTPLLHRISTLVVVISCAVDDHRTSLVSFHFKHTK